MRSTVRLLGTVAALILGLALPAWAGGGPTNVLVLVNDNSPASLEIANYYRVKRQIP